MWKFRVILTWSKIMAFVVLISGVYLDLKLETDGKLFMYSLPFVTAMIGVKQILGRNKTEETDG